MSTRVVLVMGSQRDWDVMKETGAELDRLGVDWTAHVSSAHAPVPAARGLHSAKTSSPGLKRVTEPPTCSTTPAASRPTT